MLRQLKKKFKKSVVLIVIWLVIFDTKWCFGTKTSSIDSEIISLIEKLIQNPEKINALAINELIMLEKIKNIILDKINQEKTINFWLLRQG